MAMNRAAADTFQRLGQDPQKIVGKSVWEMFPEMKGTHAPMKFEFLYPGDKRWYEIQGYATTPGVILVFRDITDRRRAS